MCDNCVKAGKMTEQEAQEQRDMFALILGGAPTGPAPENVLLASLLENPEDAFVILSEMVQGAFAAGWGLAVIRNPLGETALGLVHQSGGGGIPMGVISEKVAEVISQETGK